MLFSFSISVSFLFDLNYRSLVEALSVCFLTELDRKSYGTVLALIFKCLKKAAKKLGLDQPLKPPQGKGHKAVMVEGYWVRCGEGPVAPADGNDSYILTETVRKNLKDIARAVSLSDYPVLLQVRFDLHLKI